MKNKPKILVVDDENRNLRLMEAMLIPLGYEVVLARDGIEALDQARKIPPDVILLGIMMSRTTRSGSSFSMTFNASSPSRALRVL